MSTGKNKRRKNMQNEKRNRKIECYEFTGHEIHIALCNMQETALSGYLCESLNHGRDAFGNCHIWLTPYEANKVGRIIWRGVN